MKCKKSRSIRSGFAVAALYECRQFQRRSQTAATIYFFFAFLDTSSSNAAWAAARRATGTRNGEQLT